MRLWSSQRGLRIGFAVSLVIATFVSFAPTPSLAAANLNDTMVRLTNMMQNAYTSGSVCLQPTTSEAVDNSDYILVQFPANFTLSTTLSNWTTSITAPSSPGSGSNYWPSTAVGWPVALTATNVNGTSNTVTFHYASAQNLSISQIYCFDWTNSTAAAYTGVFTASEEGTLTLEDATPTAIDTGNYAVSVLSGGNQIVVNATVPPIFQFTMTGNTDGFGGNLSYSTVNATGGVTANITTNAKGGWIMWAEDSNQGLRSTTASKTIASVGWNGDVPSTLTAGTEGYALGVTKQPAGTTICSASNLSVAPEYDTTGHAGTNGGDVTANFSEIGQCTGAPSANDGLKLVESCTIAATTPAATDYTDIITVVGAGNF
jgi:hypothetical protein